MLSKKLTVALGTGIFALGAAGSAHAATITVNNINSSGAGSLRSAIIAANGTPLVTDTIKFSIPGNALHTITPATALPPVTAPVKINGYTQTDAGPATDVSPATLKIAINAVNADEGLLIQSGGVTVKGLDIYGAGKEGVRIEGDDNVVTGNYIGTGDDGSSAPAPNDLEGVRVSSGDDNLIGGPGVEDRNVIAGSAFADVLVESGAGNTVQNNYIGIGADGASDLGDARGVQLQSSDNVVRDNVISGESTGVEIVSDANVVQGNKLGTNAAGTAEVPNVVGVSVIGGDDNKIGGSDTGESNVVSGNEHNGVELKRFSTTDPAERNDVQGNLIGVTAAGDARLPNGESGVLVSASEENTIGGTRAGTGNVLSGNDGDGVELVDADNNKVLGNRIGTDLTGALDLGNDGAGVNIDGVNNRIGDTTGALAPNTIAHNGEDGVTLTAGTGDAVLRNSIHDNTGAAVDVGADGLSANDPDDTDLGPNERQNGPEIQSATATDVEWLLDSDPTTRYRLEFFANDSCSGASVTEAQTFLGSTTVTTDANGNADDVTAITLPAGAGPNISMTATRLERVLTGLFPPTFTLVPRSTSEVSPCETI